MTLALLHVIRDYIIHLQGLSIPNHTSHIKYIKYALIILIKNTESLTKSLQNTESDWQ